LIPGAGHFLHQEEPDVVTGEILRWLKTPQA
jgi:pimeloyl-ACP methyl ester carboxylesterase